MNTNGSAFRLVVFLQTNHGTGVGPTPSFLVAGLASGPVLHSRSDLQPYLLTWRLSRATIFKPSALGETESLFYLIARRAHCGRDARGPSIYGFFSIVTVFVFERWICV
jgi:hypothetical protein